MQGKEIRKTFLEYFQTHDHTVVPSSSLIPAGDPTLMFTNAGMVPFKDVFLGIEQRDYKRATSSQKCVRAGGKHNDLDMVGRTARHHTFFEMLGNFSFGDYFKKDAIEMGWEFLTDVIKLPKDKLWITVYNNDDDAYNIWQKDIKIPSSRIIRMGDAENFWSMGDTGPCGPCSEIHIDQGEKVGCGKPSCSIECDCDRYLELWNLVFMQFDRDSSGKMTPLPNPSIDTGLGLERLSAVVQEKISNFDCDLIRPLIANLEDEFTKKYGDNEKDDISLRVISDHIRASTFLISDGVMPSNEGKGYVLRRILRRALRHGRMLGKETPFLHKITAEVVHMMKDIYPELIDRSEYISRIILSEEERFETTLHHGLNLIDEVVKETKKKNSQLISGKEIFKLYDTYGFPLDLAEDIAEDANLKIDIKEFNESMDGQKQAARASWKGSGEKNTKQIYKNLVGKISKITFSGYQSLKEEVEIVSILKGEEEIDEASKGEDVELIFTPTPFYGESGGQLGDTGNGWNNEAQVTILNTIKPVSSLIIHKCKIEEGKIKKGDTLTVHINEKKRAGTVRNHSATHLLHSALRQVLGDHVKQAGSLVGHDRLRFDFTHFSQPDKKELNRIEEIVNQKIRENLSINTEELDIDAALKKGATALFGEKYGDLVRMVKMGEYSNELCGGTHANATGDIGIFKITNEAGIAAGTRRIEAVTGEDAYNYFKKEEKILTDIQNITKSRPFEETIKIQKMVDQIKQMEKEVDSLKQKIMNLKGDDIFSGIKKISGVSVLSAAVDGLDGKTLRTFIDTAKNKMGSGVIVAGTTIEGKVLLAAGVTKDITGTFHAGNILKEIAPIVGGSGGGRPDMAQAGGKDPSRLKEALEKVYTIIEKLSPTT